MIRKRHQIIGKRFGNGTVISELEPEIIGSTTCKYPRYYQTWKLKCDCGNEYKSASCYLLYGQGTHCGCMRKENLLGKRFGNAVVIKYVGRRIRGKTSPRSANVWELQCDCGKTFNTYSEFLMAGCTSSCGCHKAHFHNTYHRRSFAQYFATVKNDAKRRGRLVTVTKEQLENLMSIQSNKCRLSGLPISFDDGSASLDRIDNEKNYSIENVQWVHRKINYMKNTLPQNEFLSLCAQITAFNNGRNGNVVNEPTCDNQRFAPVAITPVPTNAVPN